MATRRKDLRAGKEFYEHFTPKEMATIAACVLTPYQDLPTYQENKLSGMKRPWPIYDRIIMAVRAIQSAFEKQSVGKAEVSWVIANYNKGMQTVSSEVPLLPEEVKNSKAIWDAMLAWSSTEDSKTLKKLIDEFDGAKRCEALGFTKHEFAPFENESVVHGIEAMSLEEIEIKKEKAEDEKADRENAENTLSPSLTLIPKRRGRPAKQPVGAE